MSSCGLAAAHPCALTTFVEEGRSYKIAGIHPVSMGWLDSKE